MVAVAAGSVVAGKTLANEAPSTASRVASRPAGAPHVVERASSGAEIWQVTSEEYPQSNIYCEEPYCSVDSRYFVYERRNSNLRPDNPSEFMIVELGTWKQHLLDVGVGTTGCAMSPDGMFYYWKRASDRDVDLMRADLAKGETKAVHRLQEELVWGCRGGISPDGRLYAWGKRLDKEFKRFGIFLLDLAKGQETLIDQDPYIFDPHPHFEPGRGDCLLIQHNRGGKIALTGKRERGVGPEGATLYLLSISDGKRTPLHVGKPYTTPVTGHESWIGKTGEVILTVSAQGDYAPASGNLLGVRANQPARRISRGYSFNHVGVSRCGRLFSSDDWKGPCQLLIGSTRTGKTSVLCEAKTSRGKGQDAHPHAYLTPDLKWLIFNSDRSGFPHVHAASVPPQVIEAVASAG